MIINNHLQAIANVYTDSKTAKNAQKDTKTRPAADGRDEVVLSTQGQSFSQLLQKAKSAAEVRPERVAEMRSRIDAGTYDIGGAAIAAKMLGGLY